MSMNITMRIYKSKKVSILHLYSNNFYEPKIWSKIRQLYGWLICDVGLYASIYSIQDKYKKYLKKVANFKTRKIIEEVCLILPKATCEV